MDHKGTLPIGIEVDGKLYREYLLEEQRFKHTLRVYTDPEIASDALKEPAYAEAAIMAKRLVVEGIDKVTPEMVLDLFPEDGDELGAAIADIRKRRNEFRSEAADKGSTGN